MCKHDNPVICLSLSSSGSLAKCGFDDFSETNLWIPARHAGMTNVAILFGLDDPGLHENRFGLWRPEILNEVTRRSVRRAVLHNLSFVRRVILDLRR